MSFTPPGNTGADAAQSRLRSKTVSNPKTISKSWERVGRLEIVAWICVILTKLRPRSSFKQQLKPTVEDLDAHVERFKCL